MSRTKKADSARRIRELRSKLGLTQEQFASKVGVTFSTVNLWESGKSKPSPLGVGIIKALEVRYTHKGVKQ